MDDETRLQVRRHSRAVLSRKSGTFDWAALLLASPLRDDAAVVYAFCRTVDDVADESESRARAETALEAIRDELDGVRRPRPLIAEFRRLCDRHGISLAYPRELVRGVRSDLGRVRMENDRDLLRYCYRVAGTVGLMMSPLLGVDTTSAHPHAIDLGVGMQLTNICRDVLEDARRNRVYLPASRLADAGVDTRALLEGRADRSALANVVENLLDLADRYYRSGRSGLRYLAMGPRVAIDAAARLYHGIGDRLRELQCDPLSARAALGRLRKLGRMARGIVSALNPLTDRGSAEHRGELHAALDGLPGAAPSGRAVEPHHP
ncbi:MAG: phytoene/squalene synthase family protein [Bradymonadaceae bacterium]